jgi:hypothetical protein
METYQNNIDHIYNYDNVFLRMVGIAMGKTLSKGLRWINRFEDKKIRVLVPFYLPLVGEEDTVLDTFVDDVADRRVQLNTDQIPRGIITYQGASTNVTEFANPNQYLAQTSNINGDLKKVISKVKAVPIKINYNIDIRVATERDADLCVQKIWDVYFNYMYFRFDYYGLPLEGVFEWPSDNTIEINREDGMNTETRYKKISCSLIVNTYYPIFKVSIDDLEVCDNDDEIPWKSLGIPQPTTDFCASLKAYYEANGQSPIPCNFSKVYWDYYLNDMRYFKLSQDDRPLNSKGRPDYRKENF